MRNDITQEAPEINTGRIKELTMEKIHAEKKAGRIWGGHLYVKFAALACLLCIVIFGSISAYANEEFGEFISQILGIETEKVLSVGESVANKNYRFTVHEFISDGYVGHILFSVEAVGKKSRADFEQYRANLEHVGSASSEREREELREEYKKYYELVFNGAGVRSGDSDYLELSLQGMRKSVVMSLEPTVAYKDVELKDNHSNRYKYVFDKVRLSEIGMTFIGRNNALPDAEYLYQVELLYRDDCRDFVVSAKPEHIEFPNPDTLSETTKGRKWGTPMAQNTEETEATTEESEGPYDNHMTMNDELAQGVACRETGEKEGEVDVSISFTKSVDLDSITAIMINEVEYKIP